MRVCQFRHFGTGIASGGYTRLAASSSLAKPTPSVKEDWPLKAVHRSKPTAARRRLENSTKLLTSDPSKCQLTVSDYLPRRAARCSRRPHPAGDRGATAERANFRRQAGGGVSHEPAGDFPASSNPQAGQSGQRLGCWNPAGLPAQSRGIRGAALVFRPVLVDRPDRIPTESRGAVSDESIAGSD
jgi:hypothetical protein